MENFEIILYCIIGVCLVIVIFLVFILIRKSNKSKSENKVDDKKNEKINQKDSTKKAEKKNKPTSTIGRADIKNVNADFVENFMEFDEISDNMIVTNNSTKFVMVLKCQGINYDLLSQSEMVAVEEGFIQFLNTLRFPIQLYLQTTTVDLSESIKLYEEKVNSGAEELEEMKQELQYLTEEDTEENEETIEKLQYEIRKKINIYEYGKDIIETVEKISNNKNILKQNFYVVVPFFLSELGSMVSENTNIKEMVFSELYTRVIGLKGALKVCGIESKALDSFELVELLYVAYNRDEAERYSFRDAINAQYDRLYHTAPDVLDKRIKIMDEELFQMSANKANEEIIKARGWVPGSIDENNEMIRKLLEENEKNMVNDYSGMINEAVLNKATTNLKNKKKDNDELKIMVKLNDIDEDVEEEENDLGDIVIQKDNSESKKKKATNSKKNKKKEE